MSWKLLKNVSIQLPICIDAPLTAILGSVLAITIPCTLTPTMGLLPRGQAVLVALLCLVSWANGTDLRSKGTGKTVRFEASLSWEIWAQAGIPRKMILVNGQLPAPTLELRQGDDVEFLVMNMLPMPATIHFHGKHEGCSLIDSYHL
jgi:FtsP/CotA-like multicopper oxidase with cupredoxin domain